MHEYEDAGKVQPYWQSAGVADYDYCYYFVVESGVFVFDSTAASNRIHHKWQFHCCRLGQNHTCWVGQS